MIFAADLSLTATGIAWTTDEAVEVTTVRPPTKLRGGDRLVWIIDQMARRGLMEAALVMIEELPTYDGHGNTATKIAELHGVIKYEFARHMHRPPVMVQPTLLKILACGAGNVKKTPVIIAARERLGYTGSDDNEADALWLLQLGLHQAKHPAAVKLPATHMRALEKVAWFP